MTGQSPVLGFYVHGSPVEFDGCKNGVLIEVKGCGVYDVWKRGKGIEKLEQQLRDQSAAAASAGTSVVWFAAEKAAAQFIQQKISELGLTNITVQFMAAAPPCTKADSAEPNERMLRDAGDGIRAAAA